MKLFREKFRNVSIEVQVIEVGKELCIVIAGGDEHHIGSVSISIPRPSLKDNTILSATTSTYNFEGHKDDAIGNMFSKKLASALNRKTVVTCGIHFDNITEEQMANIQIVSEKLLGSILDEFQTA